MACRSKSPQKDCIEINFGRLITFFICLYHLLRHCVNSELQSRGSVLGLKAGKRSGGTSEQDRSNLKAAANSTARRELNKFARWSLQEWSDMDKASE